MLKKILSRLFHTKRPFRLTPAGWVFILYTIGVGAGAINTGNNLLYLIFGVFLGLILASGLLSDLCLWGVEVKCDFPDFVTMNEPGIIPVRLINGKKKFSTFSTYIEMDGTLRGKKVHLRTHIPFAGRLETVPAHFTFTPEYRGWFQIDNVRITTQYPFGLLKKWWTLRRGLEPELGTFCFPQPVALDAQSLARLRMGNEQPIPGRERGDGSTIFGLREYRESDNPRRIHWKASAKQSAAVDDSSSWLIREMEKEQEWDVFIMLPTPEDLRDMKNSELEWLVRYAVSLLEQGEESGRRVRFILKDDKSETWEVVSSGGSLAPWQFLSLWEPQRYPVSSMKNYLIPFSERDWTSSSMVTLLPAFKEWRTAHSENLKRNVA